MQQHDTNYDTELHLQPLYADYHCKKYAGDRQSLSPL